MKIIRESLNKLDLIGIDNNNYYDLRNLYEAVEPRMTPQDKQELRKLIDVTDNPETISAYLKSKDESLNEAEDLLEPEENFDFEKYRAITDKLWEYFHENDFYPEDIYQTSEGFIVDVDGDWYVDDYDDDSCKLASDKVTKGSVEGDLKITYNSFSNSAKEKADSDKKIYPKGTKIETIKIGKTQYYYFRTNTDVESGFQLYADCSDKKNVVNISSTFLTKDQAKKQLEKITIK